MTSHNCCFVTSNSYCPSSCALSLTTGSMAALDSLPPPVSRLIFVLLPPIPPPPLPSPSPPRFAANHTQPPGNEPLLSLEGCGLKHKRLISFGTRTHCIRPSPFQRDVGGSFHFRLTKELGRENNEGGPKKCEGHPVHPEKNHDESHPHLSTRLRPTPLLDSPTCQWLWSDDSTKGSSMARRRWQDGGSMIARWIGQETDLMRRRQIR